MMQEYERLFDETEKKVKNDPELLRRSGYPAANYLCRLQMAGQNDTPRSFKHVPTEKLLPIIHL